MTWSGITVDAVNKFFPESDETQKGHMNQQRENVRSTKPKPEEGKPRKGKQQEVSINVYDYKETMYTDQTGRFPVYSRAGNKYIMVICEVDSNAILVAPMKKRADKEMQKAYEDLLQRLKDQGINPKKHVLDNEVSNEFKRLIKESCNMELVPPDVHRRNRAEVAIKTFKNHFISILSGVDKSFPLNLWDKLLPQAEMTVNMLRQANIAPNCSAYQYLFGPHDYNKMPLAPMGCAVLVHEKPGKRGSWDPHAVDGWYVGTSPEHYRCHKVWIKKTGAERVSDTVFFKHRYLTSPEVTPYDAIMKALKEINEALMGKRGATGDENFKAIQQLETIFSKSSLQ